MPMLHRDDRNSLLGPTGEVCRLCGTAVQKNYCRLHDEFFEVCLCPQSEDGHVGHRNYLCAGQRCVNVITHHCAGCKGCFCGACAERHQCAEGTPPHPIGSTHCECLLLG